MLQAFRTSRSRLFHIKKNFAALFYGWRVTATRQQSHYEEAVYFLSLISQKFLVLIWPNQEGWKAESTLEPLSGFELATPVLGTQRLNH